MIRTDTASRILSSPAYTHMEDRMEQARRDAMRFLRDEFPEASPEALNHLDMELYRIVSVSKDNLIRDTREAFGRARHEPTPADVGRFQAIADSWVSLTSDMLIPRGEDVIEVDP